MHKHVAYVSVHLHNRFVPTYRDKHTRGEITSLNYTHLVTNMISEYVVITPSPTLRLVWFHSLSDSMCWSVITADRKCSNPGFVRSLVSISAIISDDEQYSSTIVPLLLWHRITWCRRSMCLLRADAMLLRPSLIVASLSSLIRMGFLTLIPSSFNTIIIHITSFRAADSALYSASVVLCAGTPGCSFDL